MYDDYISNMLREDYSPYQNTYEPLSRNTYYNQIEDYNQFNYSYPYNYVKNSTSRNLSEDIENLYPDIYRLIYPMIKKACRQNMPHVTEDTLDEITNDIYNNIEAENIINLNIDITNGKNENKTISNIKKNNTKEQENRHINNSLRDLIKILLIRELIGKNNYDRPPRPYFPGHMSFSPRPPMPGHHQNLYRPRY